MNKDSEIFDIIIIGAGIIGSVIARELSFYKLKVAVLEKKSYVCSGQSKANGAIIHGGHDPKTGTLKAKLNVEGNKIYPKLCKKIGVTFKKTGAFVIATTLEEEEKLKELLIQGIKNGVKDLRIVNSVEALEKEPNLNKNIKSALSIPSAGILDIHRFVIAIAENAFVNGVRFFFSQKVKNFIKSEDGNTVIGVNTEKKSFFTKLVINCAGVNSDEIIKLSDKQSDFKITPRKGEYYIFDKALGNIVSRPCFPVPGLATKGVLIFPSINGNTIIGGNSVNINDKYDTSTTAAGFKEVFSKICKLIEPIDKSKIITSFAGIRSTGNVGDFFINKSEKINGLINVAGIESPGISAAPAISKYVLNIIDNYFFKLEKSKNIKKDYILKPLFRELDDKEKEKLLKENPKYGRIVCRCEDITEGDIIAAINAPLSAQTVDSIKFRTLAGTGRCQGAFDITRIIKIISENLGIEPKAVLKNEACSNYIFGPIK